MNIYEIAETKRLRHDMAQRGWTVVVYAGDTPNTWPDIGVKNEQGDIVFMLERRPGQPWRAVIPTNTTRNYTPYRETALKAATCALTWIRDNPTSHQPIPSVARNSGKQDSLRTRRA